MNKPAAKVEGVILLPILIPLALPIGLGLALVAYQKRRQSDRDRLWAGWAAARNWGYTPSWPAMVHRFRHHPFGMGSSRTASRGFWGRFDNVDVFGFNYRYMTSNGKSTTTVEHLVAGVRFPGARFPQLTIARQGTIFMGGRDIQLENEAFNKAWYVNGPSKRFGHDIMHPRAMHFLMGPVPPFTRMWFDGDVLFASLLGDPDPIRTDAHLRMLAQFAGLIPDFTLRELGAAGGVTPDLSGPGVPLGEQQRRMHHWHQAHQQAMR